MLNRYIGCCRIAGLLVTAALAGCARPAAPVQAADAPAAGTQTGVVVSLRPLDASAGAHRAVLGALGGQVAPDSAARVEIVIRLADGQTVALVQAAEPLLRAGDRVALSSGRTRVARLGE